MSSRILLVSTLQNAAECAALIAGQLSLEAEVVSTRRAALAALRSREFTVVLVEEAMIETDPEWADLLWESAGPAIPLQLNFAISDSSRLIREIKTAIARRDHELTSAGHAATTALCNELKSDLTGLLLESELVLREPGLPPSLAPKLRHLLELANHLRTRLAPTPA